MTDDGKDTLNKELNRLAQYFEEAVVSAKTTNHPEVRLRTLLNGAGAERLELVRVD